jgi:hypothetical protein
MAGSKTRRRIVLRVRGCVALLCGVIASVGGGVLPAAASGDAPVVVTFSGMGHVLVFDRHIAAWLTGCDPFWTSWEWVDNPVTNVEVDTLGSAYVGRANLDATMQSTTPCGVLDSGSMTLSLVTPLCQPSCIGTAGAVNCPTSGTFVRVGARMTMALSGSCTVNGRPPIPVHLAGEWLFLGPPQGLCVCGVYDPFDTPYEFSYTSASG